MYKLPMGGKGIGLSRYVRDHSSNTTDDEFSISAEEMVERAARSREKSRYLKRQLAAERRVSEMVPEEIRVNSKAVEAISRVLMCDEVGVADNMDVISRVLKEYMNISRPPVRARK